MLTLTGSRRGIGRVLAGVIAVVLLANGCSLQTTGSPPIPAFTKSFVTPTVVIPLVLPTATRVPTSPPTGTAPPAAPSGIWSPPVEPEHSGPVTIRWYIGNGGGTESAQVAIENEVVADFNQSQDKIKLVMDVQLNATAQSTLASEIASGSGPDIVGPIGWAGSNAFPGQWLDLAPYIDYFKYDTSKFEAALTQMYQTDQGTVGLPFAVYPSAIFYSPYLFSQAGVNPPPFSYGEQYKMPDGSLVDWNWDTLAKVARLLTLDAAGKHSGEAGFNPDKIVQYGFCFGWENHPNYWATYMSNGGQMLLPGGSKGSYVARIPNPWRAAWSWVYEGLWGAEPFIPNGGVVNSGTYNYGNAFASGRVAMAVSPAWYLAGLNDMVRAGYAFDFAAMPVSLNGQVAGRVDADTFRIWKGTPYPVEAFTVLTYLIDTGINKLVVGSNYRPPAYSAVPGQSSLRGPWLATQKVNFPFVSNWDVLLAGLNYPDVPNAEAYMPYMQESWNRLKQFGDSIFTNRGVPLASQENLLETDLTNIFNK
jgi:multiple sugar transport system substrate-binding protein